MVKRFLSMLSVILAMGFVFMSPASAMDTDFALSFDAPAPDKAISIDDNQVVLPTASMIIEKPIEKTYSVTSRFNAVVFSEAKGGGFSLAHGIRPRSY